MLCILFSPDSVCERKFCRQGVQRLVLRGHEVCLSSAPRDTASFGETELIIIRRTGHQGFYSTSQL